MTEHKPIPHGWRFYTADFSIDGRKGVAMLTRDAAGKERWHRLDKAGQDNIPLYLSGYGSTINEAIDDAIRYISKEDVWANI